MPLAAEEKESRRRWNRHNILLVLYLDRQSKVTATRTVEGGRVPDNVGGVVAHGKERVRIQTLGHVAIVSEVIIIVPNMLQES